MGDGDIAVLITDPSTDPELAHTATIALERLGAVVTVVGVAAKQRSSLLAANPAAAGAVNAADFVVDLSAQRIETDSELEQILEGGLLTVTVKHPAELDQLNPHPGLAQRVERARGLFTRGAQLDASSEAGTAFEVNLRSARTSSTDGVARDSGEVDQWPAGRVWAVPTAESVSGTIVVMPGDIIWEARTFVRSPIVLTLKKDHITDIDGESGDADLLRSLLEAQNDPEAYGIASIGFGLNLTRRPDDAGPFDQLHLSNAEGPLSAGTLNVVFGSNDHAGRTSPATVTVCLRQCNVVVDGVPLLHGGALEGSLAPDVYEQVL